MSIRDRGTIKWTSLMLPEHVKMLRQHFEEDYYKVEKPELDEQKIEELNEVISEAMEFHREIEISYYEQGHIRTAKGYLHYVDALHKTLHVLNLEDSLLKLKLQDIVDIQ